MIFDLYLSIVELETLKLYKTLINIYSNKENLEL